MDFNDAMLHRFACRKYKERDISEENLSKILDYGRLTPSSFGLEGWAFHVVKGEKREALFEAAFRQDAVRLAPLSVVIVSRRGFLFEPHGDLVTERATRIGNLDEFVAYYAGYYDWMKGVGRLDAWARSQCYLAGANMMTGAKTLGIDSIALEGFDEDAVLSVLDLPKEKWLAALVLPFGYADEPERGKIREPLENLVVVHE
jgi:nitroreductase